MTRNTLLSFGLAAVLLAGCAAQRANEEGRALLAEGRVEEGLNRLAEAAHAAPDKLAYRADLVRHRDQAITRLLAAAANERAAGRPAGAQALYERVLALDAGNGRARQGLEGLQMDARHDAAVQRAEALVKQRDTDGALAALKPVLVESPQHGKALALRRRIEDQQAREALAEPSLKARFTKPVSLQFRDANLKMVFEALSRTSGLNVLLDRDVKPDLKTSIFVKDVSVEDTINLILLQNQLEKKVISDNTVFVYPATAAKIKDYQDLKIRSFHLSHADPKQMLAMIKTVLKTKDIFIHEKTNSIVIRDTPDAIRLAEKMIADQDTAQPEVMLEVEVLEVTRSRLQELGIQWPSSVTLSTPLSAGTLGELRSLGRNDLRVTSLAATLNLRLEQGDTNVLASPRIRVRNREKAKIMIGSRVPVITNAVTPVSTGTPVITGSVQYLDVGLKLDVEPDINLDDEVVIKVGLDVSSIVREVPNVQSGTLAYEIGTRNATTVLRLKDGETQILAGLISDEERRAAAKVPGLGQIPLVGALFGTTRDNGAKSEIVLSITPRIVSSARTPSLHDVEYWAGTEATLRSEPLTLRPMGKVAMSGGSAAPAATARPAAPPRSAAATPPVAAAGPAGAPLAWQGPAQALPGARISLTLHARAMPATHRLDLQVGFDPAVLKAVDVAEGPLLQQASLVLGKTISQDRGVIDLDLSGRGSEGAAGTGTLVTLVFEVLAPHAGTPLTVTRLSSSGPGGEGLVAAPAEPHVIVVKGTP